MQQLMNAMLTTMITVLTMLISSMLSGPDFSPKSTVPLEIVKVPVHVAIPEN